MRLPFLLVTLALSVGRSRAQGVSAAVSASFSASQVEAAFTDAGTQVASASVPGGTTVGAPSAAIPSPAPSASASATDGGPAPTPAFFYPQPPLPSVSATRNSNAWTLSPDWEITDVPVSHVLPLPRSYMISIVPGSTVCRGCREQGTLQLWDGTSADRRPPGSTPLTSTKPPPHPMDSPARSMPSTTSSPVP